MNINIMIKPGGDYCCHRSNITWVSLVWSYFNWELWWLNIIITSPAPAEDIKKN